MAWKGVERVRTPHTQRTFTCVTPDILLYTILRSKLNHVSRKAYHRRADKLRGCASPYSRHTRGSSPGPHPRQNRQAESSQVPCQSANRTKGKGLRPKGAASMDRVTSPTIKSGRIKHGLGLPLASSFGRQSKRHDMKPRRQGRKERTALNHRGRALVPTYTAMDAERSPASPKGQHGYLLERTYR